MAKKQPAAEGAQDTTNAQDESTVQPGTNQFTADKPTPASGRIQVAKKDYDASTGELSVLFGDGTKRTVLLSELPESITTQLAMHGLSQKLGHSYASVKGDVAKAVLLFDTVLSQLKSGEWAKACGDGEGSSRVTELAEAIARFKNVPIEKAQQVVGAASEDNIKAWKGSPKIKAVIAQIRAEKAAARAAKEDATSGAEADAAVDAIQID